VTALLAVASVLAVAPGNPPGQSSPGSHFSGWVIAVVVVVVLAVMGGMLAVLRSRK
jgi:hypothetical protein